MTTMKVIRNGLADYLWTAEHYAGFSPTMDYHAAAVTRDSDSLERANFKAMEAILSAVPVPEPEDDGPLNQGGSWVYSFRARHWAVGWVDHLMVRGDAPQEVLETLLTVLEGLQDYPVIDDETFAQEAYEEACDVWDQLNLAERLDVISDHGCGTSKFAARRSELPHDIDWAALIH